jgi:RNA polymerase sigma-70 factor (ECF subfamily)
MSKAYALPFRLFADAKAGEGVGEPTEEVVLIRRAQAGDADAFAKIVEKHWKRAFWTAYDVLYDHDRAQDVAQEAFVKVYRALQSFDMGRDFASWLYRIVLNLAIDHKRRRDRDRSVPTDKVEELFDSKKALVEDDERAATTERVEVVLSSMPEKYRIPLTLKDIDGLPVEEVARILDISYSTVRWRLHKARAMFRDRYQRLLRREEGGRVR